MNKLLLLAPALCLLTGCDQPVPPPTTALAKIGSKEIFAADLVAEARRRAAAGLPVPPKAALLDEMVRDEALIQRALTMKLDQDPEVARDIRSVLIGALKGRKLEPQLQAPEVTQAEVQAYYEAHAADYAVPEKARLGLIFVALPARAPVEQTAPIRARMDAARAMAAGTDGFTRAAATHSEHQGSRYTGGDIGWVVRGKSPGFLPASVAEAAFTLQPGALSEVIEDKNGLYLVTLLDHQPAGVAPLAQVEPSIRTKLTLQHQQRMQREFDEQTRRLAGVRTFPGNLRQTHLPQPEPASQPPAAPRTASN